MSRRTSESNKAILAAWNKEQELVLEGKGTREWTPQQQQDILEKGKAYDDNGKAFEGQHMKSAEMYPEYQGEPGNIQFLTRAEHLEAHDGNWQNPTNWYFNPLTKEKFDFGDSPFIPCEIIQLSEPIISIKFEQKKGKKVIPEPVESIHEKKLKDTLKTETPYLNNQPKHSKATISSEIGFGQKLKNGIKNIGKAIVKFQVNHPTATKVIKGVGIFAAAFVAEAVVESTTNGSSGAENIHSSDGSNYDDESYTLDKPEDDYYNYSSDDDNLESTDRAYTPNDVPEHEQTYHTKNGPVKKQKASYHREGKHN